MMDQEINALIGRRLNESDFESMEMDDVLRYMAGAWSFIGNQISEMATKRDIADLRSAVIGRMDSILAQYASAEGKTEARRA